MSNVIFLEFYSKKSFPPGKWINEPDYCEWVHSGLNCIAIRDMTLGVWKGFVGIEVSHPFYGKSIEDLLKNNDLADIFFSVYGGICFSDRLPKKYKFDSKWWLGIETSHGGDFMPLLKLESQGPDMDKMLSGQTYKDFNFIRKETNKLAQYVSRVK